MNILEVQDLCKTYGTGETEVHALNHVSFSVRKGEFIAIIGESGSANDSNKLTFTDRKGYMVQSVNFCFACAIGFAQVLYFKNIHIQNLLRCV